MNLKERKEKLLEDVKKITEQVNNGSKTIDRMLGAIAIIDEQLAEEPKSKDKK